MPGPTVFLTSDVHLGAVPPETEASFHRWLLHAGAHGDAVVVNGDLFDFWFEYRSAIPRGHTRTLGILADLVDGGVRVILLGGNHDWWGGTYLTDEVGVEFYHEPIALDLADWRVLLAHGDGLGEGDRGYKLLQSVLRSPLAIGGFRWLHPDWGAALARMVSRTERRAASEHRHDGRIRNAVLREWAEARLAEDAALDIVAFGHTHLPDQLEVGNGRYILNTGDWVYRRTYTALRPGVKPEIQEWKD